MKIYKDLPFDIVINRKAGSIISGTIAASTTNGWKYYGPIEDEIVTLTHEQLSSLYETIQKNSHTPTVYYTQTSTTGTNTFI